MATSGDDTRSTSSLIPWKGFVCIVAQHTSSAWSEQCLEFAAFLFLIVLFPTTLIPASSLGLSMTLASLVFAHVIGNWVDKYPRLWVARWALFVQKSAQIAMYSVFLVLFTMKREQLHPSGAQVVARLLSGRPLPWGRRDDTNVQAGMTPMEMALIFGLTVFATMGRLSTTVIDIAVDRDWVLVISSSTPDSSNLLTTFNASLRRAFLFCKLISPLFVSLLTSFASYPTACSTLLAMSLLSLGGELWWIGVVWNSWACLEEAEVERRRVKEEGRDEMASESRGARSGSVEGVVEETIRDMIEFAQMPVFLSESCDSMLYLTTLQFDGVMLSYLKSELRLSDIFISIMRGITVVAGLLGTVVMPYGERLVGLERTGAWSIWLEALLLVPVVICFYVVPQHAPFPPFIAFTLFGCLALSRLGLYAFDLVQVQCLQLELQHHPKRNRFTSLQIAMQSVSDLAKWGMVFVFSRPDQFRWTALISTISVIVGAIIYSAFLRKVRGHLFHLRFDRRRKQDDRAGDSLLGEDGVGMELSRR
ncbi:hypothetical protein FFLO_06572 [Filobasidium floriforme]|uniref:Solute carrier family 40 member n=1 Tax=Filobasidium floriforme TaxID=5210 RepID=A0A8K0JH11_9TREE|nr:hypothetical protein FFLO_06572 [Filobasidium floriforme]